MGSEADDESVDPVPFLVVVATGALVSVAFVPAYVLSLGGAAWLGLVVAGVVTVAITAVAYHRMIAERRAGVHQEVPPEARLRTIVYGVIVACAAMFGLSILALLA